MSSSSKSLRHRCRTAWGFIEETLTEYSRDRGDLVAAALAFNTLLSIAPLIIIAVAIAGIVLGILSIIEAIVVIVLSVWVFNEVGGTDYMQCLSDAGSDQDAVQRCVDQFQNRVEDQFSVTLTTPAGPTS